MCGCWGGTFLFIHLGMFFSRKIQFFGRLTIFLPKYQYQQHKHKSTTTPPILTSKTIPTSKMFKNLFIVYQYIFAALLLRTLPLASAAAATTTSTTPNNLRGLQTATTCPDSMPNRGDACATTETCYYDYFLIPTYNDDYSCAGPFTCTSISRCVCGGIWMCASSSYTPCSGDVPEDAFQACTP